MSLTVVAPTKLSTKLSSEANTLHFMALVFRASAAYQPFVAFRASKFKAKVANQA
jgi:hypothetical protein